MSNNKKKYTIEFDVNKASLNQLKTTLQEIQKMSVGDFRVQSPQGFNSLGEAAKELSKIQKQAYEVEKVLEKAFNPKLGVANLTQFSEGIKKIGIDDLTRGWAQLGAVGESATRHLTTGLVATNTELRQSHKLLDDMATSFKNTVKWGISSAVFNTMTNSLQASWNYAKNLNKSLTDIRIVSEQSAAQMEKFALQASKAAKNLGATTLDYSNAALLYYQQGDSPEQVAKKAELTVKMANVLGSSASEVSNYMTSIWNNFAEGGENLEYYADVLTKLGAATASSAEEISTGLEKFASVAKTVDLSYEYATAALTTITSTTRQSADIVGTALKTLFARIQDLELGETLEDGTTLGKYSEALEKIGISLKGQDGQIKSMDKLLDEMGSKWETLSKNQKIALAQTVAGTRQYTQLVALMDNWDIMEQNIQMAREATGALQEQQDKYMEGTEAHLNKLTAATERFMDALIDDKAVNGLIDVLTDAVDLLANFVESVGGGSSALLMFGSIGTKVFSKQIAESLAVTTGNFRAGKREIEDYKTSLENLEAVKIYAGQENNPVPDIVNNLKSAESVMNSNQIKEVNELTQMLSNEIDKMQRQADQVDQAAQLMKNFNMQTDSPLTAYEHFDIDGLTKKVTSSAGEMSKAISEFKNSVGALYDPNSTGDLNAIIENFEIAKSKIADFSEAYGGAFEQEQSMAIENNIDKLEEFIQKLKELNQEQEKGLEDGDFEKKLNSITSENEAELYRTVLGLEQGGKSGISTTLSKSTYIVENLGKEAITQYNNVEAKSKSTSDAIIRDLNRIANAAKDTKSLESFVTGLSGIGQIVSGMITLSNLDNIWNDENLSGWEKFLQITMNITSALPMLIMGLKNVAAGAAEIVNFFRGFLHTVTFGKITLENKALEESTDKATKAARELNKAMSTEMTTATAARVANDKAIIASNNAVIASNKARAASENGNVGGDLFDDLLATDPDDMVGPMGGKASNMPDLAGDILDVMDGDKTDDLAKELFSELFEEGAEEVVGQGMKKILKEGTEEGLEQGLKGVVKNQGLFAGLKTKIAGLFGGGASGGAAGAGASGATVLGMSLGKLALVAGGAAAAIGLVAGVVALMTHEQRQAEKQAKKLAEAVEESEKAYQKASDAQKNFQSTLSSFNSAIDSINKLTKGTLEWKTAMLEINEQAYKLMDAYPELIKYMDTSQGYITFSEEGINSINAALLTRAQLQQERVKEAKVAELEFQLSQLEKEAARKTVNFSKLQLSFENRDYFNQDEFIKNSSDFRNAQKSLEAQRNIKGLTDDDAKRIVNAFRGHEDLLYKEGNDDEILDLLKKNNIDLSRYTEESKSAFVADLRGNADDIRGYTSSIDRYTEQIAAYTAALLANKDIPEGATSYEYFVTYEQYKDNLIKQRQQETKDKYNFNKKNEVKGDKDQDNIIEEYAKEVLGWTDPSQYTVDKGGFWDNIDHDKEFKIWNGDHEETITYEEAAKRIGEYKANKELNEGKHDKEIGDKSIASTQGAKTGIVGQFNRNNAKLTEALNNGTLGASGININDKNKDGQITSDEFTWTDNEKTEQDREDYIKLNEERVKKWSATASDPKKYTDALKAADEYKKKREELIKKGVDPNSSMVLGSYEKNLEQYGIYVDPITGEVVQPDYKMEEDPFTKKKVMKADDTKAEETFNTRLNNKRNNWIKNNFEGVTVGKDANGNETLSFTLHGHTDPNTGATTFPQSHPEIENFDQWMEDVFMENDVASLYTPEQNQVYLKMLEEYKKQIGEETWNKYYANTSTGKKMEEYAQSETNEGIGLTDEERAKREKAETERLYKEGIEQRSEKLGVSQEAFKVYADQLQEDNKKLKEYGRTQREINDLVLQTTETHFDFANKLQKVNETVADNEDLLKKWGKSGIHDLNELDPKDAETIGKVVEAMQGMFGEEVDTDWVQEHIEEIIKLANGDMSVYDDLLKDYMDYIVSDLEIDMSKVHPSLDIDDKATFEKEMNNFLDGLDIENLEIGTEITMNDEEFLATIGKLVDSGAMKAEDIEDMFGAYGFKVDWVPEETPKSGFGTWLENTFGITGASKLDGTETISVPKLTWVGTNDKTFNPGGSVGNGGGKSSSPRKIQKTEDAFDRYHDVDTELKKLANSMEEINRTTERSTGSQWIANLTDQFSLLNQEIAVTEEKLKIAEGELAELQGDLAGYGARFGEDGTLLNYEEIYYKAFNELRAAEDHMAGLSADGQDAYEDTYEKIKEKYDKVVELVSRYDEVFLELIPGLKKDIKEKVDEKTQIKIDVFTAEIDLRLEMADFDANWRDFKRKVIDKIEEDDILGNAKADLGLFDIYYNEEGKGTIQKLTEQVKKDLEQLQQFEAGQDMSVYGDFSKTQLEDMKSHLESLMAEMEDLYDLQERIRESYLNMMDEANEKFEEQISLYEQVSSLIEHDMNLISLIYGEDAYTELGQYFDQLHSNNLQSLDMLRQQATFWQDEMAKHDVGSDEWEKAKENWLAAVDELTAKTEESINTVKEKFTNSIEAIFQTLNDEVTNGKGLDYLSKEWELINQNSDKYLDNMNGIYAIQKLQNKYQEAIDSNDGLKTQQQLKSIMDSELKALREKDKLTQYDVDRAELRYQIALKQAALEEAQQNKTTMRLRRDSQGNYTYQYTADEEQISKLESEMSDLYQQLYNLDANEYKNNLDELYNVWVAFQEDMKAAEQINDEQEKQERKMMLTEQYGKRINDIVARDEELKKNLHESTMSGLLDLYNANAENYNNMTAEQQQILDSFLTEQTDLTGTAYNNLFELYDDCVSEFRGMADAQKDILVSSMLPQWNSTLAEMMTTINGAGGFEEVCKKAFKELENANKEYRESLKEIEKTAGVSFDAIKGGYDKNTVAVKSLIKENNTLIQSYKDQLEEIAKVIAEMDKIIEQYGEAAEAARKYGEEAYKAWLKAQGINADELKEGADKILNPDPEPKPDPKPEPEKPKEITKNGKVKAGSGAMIYDYAGDTSGERQYFSKDPTYTVLQVDGNWVKVRHHSLSSGVTGWFKKGDLTALNTGGYTGEWGNSGRLALLHQKELVLNAQDTRNMLNAINIVRAITDNLGASLLNRMGNIAANAGAGLFGGSEGLAQTVHIDAQFPNVTSSSEIEDALNNLVNRAAQHITKN